MLGVYNRWAVRVLLRYRAEILPIRRKKLLNQLINVRHTTLLSKVNEALGGIRSRLNLHRRLGEDFKN